MHKITVNGVVTLETRTITAESIGMGTAAYRIMFPGFPIFDVGIIYP